MTRMIRGQVAEDEKVDRCGKVASLSELGLGMRRCQLVGFLLSFSLVVQKGRGVKRLEGRRQFWRVLSLPVLPRILKQQRTKLPQGGGEWLGPKIKRLR